MKIAWIVLYLASDTVRWQQDMRYKQNMTRGYTRGYALRRQDNTRYNKTCATTKQIANLQNFLQNKQRAVQYFAINFKKSFFFWCHKSSKCKTPKCTESKRLNQFSRFRGIVKQGLRHLFITSSNSHFFHKTDLELYLFKKIKFPLDIRSLQM